MLWRRFLVRSDGTLADLHVVLQIGQGAVGLYEAFPSPRFEMLSYSMTSFSIAACSSVTFSGTYFSNEQSRSRRSSCKFEWQ